MEARLADQIGSPLSAMNSAEETMLQEDRPRRRQLDPFTAFLERRGTEVGWNGMVLHRELRALGFQGGYLQVQRYLQPLRAQQHWATLATIRFETHPGEQAQVDFGQTRVWIGEQGEEVHLFVFTLRVLTARVDVRLPARAAQCPHRWARAGVSPLRGRPAGVPLR
ncbi:MAG: hypothetical protein ACT4O4_02950 [Nitrospiraceae bacterium]